ncbi:MAG: arsenate reductase ArsC [Bdellovibrionota bacterium]
MKILFMCVANSARSQLAEGLAKSIFGNKAWVESAGSAPKKVNPFAIQVLKEIGIDISSHHSKSFDDLKPDFTADLNFIITLCAEEVCPAMASKTAQRLHWPFKDPAGQDGTDEEQLERFRHTRELIKKQITAFASEMTK